MRESDSMAHIDARGVWSVLVRLWCPEVPFGYVGGHGAAPCPLVAAHKAYADAAWAVPILRAHEAAQRDQRQRRKQDKPPSVRTDAPSVRTDAHEGPSGEDFAR